MGLDRARMRYGRRLRTMRRRPEFQRLRGGVRWSGPAFVLEGKPRDPIAPALTDAPATRFGFTITAPEIGSRAAPPMRFDGPYREDEAALAHVGFWPA